MLAQIGREPLESAADRRLVDSQLAANLQQRLPVEKVRTQHKPVLRWKRLEGPGNRLRQSLKLPSCRRNRCNRRRDLKCSGQSLYRSLPPRPPVVVDESLPESRPQPGKQRPAPRIRRQRRPPLALCLTQSVQLRVERVRKIVTQRRRARDRNRCLCQRAAVHPNKSLPRRLNPKRASLRQRKLRKMQ